MYSRNRSNQAYTVAHNWAHQIEAKFKKDSIAGSLYYQGNTIYSYGSHFPIATHTTNKKGVKAIVMTTKGYSNTTAKHISIVGSAISHENVIYCPHLPAGFYTFESEHANNFNRWVSDIKSIAKSLPRAKKPEIYITQINAVLDLVKKYSDYFGVKPNKEQAKVFKLPVEGFKLMAEKAHKEAEKRKAERLIFEQKQHDKTLAEFRGFESDYVDTSYILDHNRAYLRYNAETKRIETSKRVEIPVLIAKKFYQWVQTTVKNGGCIGDCKMTILDFEVKAVNENELIVGCHTISMAEVKNIANLLKW